MCPTSASRPTSHTRAVIVADDHELIRRGLCELLRHWQSDLVIGEAADGGDLSALLEADRAWDLMLIDLSMPGFGGEAAVRALLAAHPGVPVLVVSGLGDPATMTRLLEAGVAGYLPKSLDGRLMLKAIELVLAGGRYVPPEALLATLAPQAGVVTGDADITPRQREILALLVQGLPNKVIATRLAIAEATVKMHVTALLKAHGARSRAELVARSRDAGPIA